MSYFSAQWGSDPSSDIVKLAQSFTIAQAESALLMVPTHPIFNSSGIRAFDFRAPSSALPQDKIRPVKTDLAAVAQFLRLYFPAWRAHSRPPHSDELILQIDNAFSQIDSGVHAPCPLNFYRYVLETRYWKKVTLINWGSDQNPVSQQLLSTYPRIKKFSGDIMSAWQLLLNSSNAAIGSSILAQALCVTSNNNNNSKRIWVPQYAAQAEFISSGKMQVYPIGVDNYFSANSWHSSSAQREVLLNHPPSGISDQSRWVFTETERCRSFEFCQPCRNTGPTGKLWRGVIQQRFDVPKRDWDCPHGWKWGGKPGAVLTVKKKLRIGTIIKKTTTALGVKACIDCEQRGKKLDGERR